MTAFRPGASPPPVRTPMRRTPEGGPSVLPRRVAPGSTGMVRVDLPSEARSQAKDGRLTCSHHRPARERGNRRAVWRSIVGRVAQLGERCVRNAEVASSILAASTILHPRPSQLPGLGVQPRAVDGSPNAFIVLLAGGLAPIAIGNPQIVSRRSSIGNDAYSSIPTLPDSAAASAASFPRRLSIDSTSPRSACAARAFARVRR